MPSDQTRVRELRERLSQCIALARVSAASGDSRALQQVLALLWAALESLDRHSGAAAEDGPAKERKA
jgi:hypothetical protein